MLKTFDYRCMKCDAVKRDAIMPAEQTTMTCVDPKCGGVMNRVWLMAPDRASGAVIGDECDVHVRHGLCWPDGTPRRFESKSEMKKVAKQTGWTNLVEHKPDSRDGDSSKHTSRWI